jgi:hypothetical protein
MSYYCNKVKEFVISFGPFGLFGFLDELSAVNLKITAKYVRWSNSIKYKIKTTWL